MLDVTLIPILEDNYTYLIQSEGKVGIIDPGEADPIIKKLEELNLTLDYIFNTHHHYDHIDGNAVLKNKYNAQIIAPASEQKRISNIDIAVNETSEIMFGNEAVKVIETAGHTTGHICFYFPDSNVLFAGDTLFSMGCGRLFEGTPEDMFNSIQKIKALPLQTKIYCGHEYTLTNGNFCLSVDGDNQDLKARMKDAQNLRAQDKPTIPTTIELELKTNIFMRAETVEDFAHYRSLRDNF